jgi:hypothetical protein
LLVLVVHIMGLGPRQVRLDGPVNGDLPIEPPWPQERRVQYTGPVGGSEHNDTAVASEAIHLRQELVNGLLPLVITPTKSGINLINEDNAVYLSGFLRKSTTSCSSSLA